MNFKKQILLSVLQLLLVNVWSQGTAEQLLLEVSVLGGTHEVKWYPFNYDTWENGNEAGYWIARTELDENGSLKEETTTRLNTRPIGPKSETWFTTNEEALDGYVGILGKLLYDSTFQFQSALLDSEKMRYTYAIYETQLSDNIAASMLGLHLLDSTAVDGLRYQYTVTAANNPKVHAAIHMDAEAGFWISSEASLALDLPNDISLTDMSGRLLERPLDVIRMTARAYGDSIVLRWGPNHAVLWEAANREGYLIERFLGNGTDLDSLALVKAWPQEELTAALIASDTMALVASQTLYGGLLTPPGNIFDQATVLENRFGFALYAAERSILAANLLGLRYVDTNVKDGQTYTYLISSPASRMFTARDIRQVENVFRYEPPPTDFEAREADGVIYLKWNKPNNATRFSAYNIERSDDGGETYRRLNANPIVFLEDDRVPMDSYGYVDSIENNVLYYYRLKGLTPFAEESEAALTVAKGRDLTPPPNPVIYHSELFDDTTTMYIKWAIDLTAPDLAGYKVLFGRGQTGHFDTLTNLLPIDSMGFKYFVKEGTDRTHFFKVLAYDTSNNISESEAVYIHYPDLVPPEPPTNLEAVVNDEGEVTIVWDHSVSEDAEGYWVYYAHALDELWVPVNKHATELNILRDTLPLRTLNKKIFYAIRTQDDNYNRSPFSEVVEVRRPDVVAPQPPILKEPIGLDTMIAVSFLPSVSDDVEVYELYRRWIEEEDEWSLIDTFPADGSYGYLDTDCEYDRNYEYRVRAKDFSDNYSDYSLALSGRRVFDPEVLKVEDVEVYFDEVSQSVHLSWGYIPPTDAPRIMEDYQFYIFKSYGTKVVEQFAKTDGDTTIFTDDNFRKGALYNYAIMVVYNSGINSGLSEIKSLLID